MAKKRKIKWAKSLNFKTYFIIFFIVAVAASVFFLNRSLKCNNQWGSLFCVSDIVIRNNYGDNLKKEIIKSVRNKLIFSLDIQSIRIKLLHLYPELKKINIVKKFPSTLEIEIEKRIPFFQIESDKYYILDKDFKVIEERRFPEKDLIVVKTGNMEDRLRKGAFISDSRVRNSAQLIEVLSKFDIFLPEVILAKSTKSILFVSHGTKIILGEGDFERKLTVLESLLKNKFNNDLSLLRYVDLRYSKVYIGKK